MTVIIDTNGITAPTANITGFVNTSSIIASSSITSQGSGLNIANWTTAGRPSSPVAGQTGYNTSYGGLELYNGTAWTTLSGGPTFCAHLYSSTQSLTGSQDSKITLTTKLWDTANAFNNTGSTVTLNGLSVPSYSFCPPVAGYYQLSGMVQFGSTPTSSIDFFRNGVFNQNGDGFRGELSICQAPFASVLMYLNGTGDYVDMRVYVSVTTSMMSQTGANYFQASFVRGA